MPHTLVPPLTNRTCRDWPAWAPDTVARTGGWSASTSQYSSSAASGGNEAGMGKPADESSAVNFHSQSSTLPASGWPAAGWHHHAAYTLPLLITGGVSLAVPEGRLVCVQRQVGVVASGPPVSYITSDCVPSETHSWVPWSVGRPGPTLTGWLSPLVSFGSVIDQRTFVRSRASRPSSWPFGALDCTKVSTVRPTIRTL